MELANDVQDKQLKVLFLCWGYSIHAYRRIKLFVDDDRFKIGVVSNYRYNFENTENFYLNGSNKTDYNQLKKDKGAILSKSKKNYFQKQKIKKITTKFELYIAILKTLFILLPKEFLKPNGIKRILHEIKIGINDYRVLNIAVKNFKPDLIFLQTLLYPCYLAFFLPYSIPQIITFWNGDVTWWAKWNGIDRIIKKQIVTYGTHRADLITVNSKLAASICQTTYRVSKDKIMCLHYPGVNLDHFKPMNKNDAKKLLNIKSEKIILWPRGLGGYLNSDVFIQSSPAIIQKYPDIFFLIISSAGGEEEKNNHYNLTRKLGVEKHFIFNDHVSYKDMPLYYGCSNAVVSISSNDSLPNVMIEAMACGIPLVMGDIPQIRDWITDGYNGYLVPTREPDELSDKLIKVLSNYRNKNDLFVKNNFELVKLEFDSKKNVEKIKNLVLQIPVRKSG